MKKSRNHLKRKLKCDFISLLNFFKAFLLFQIFLLFGKVRVFEESYFTVIENLNIKRKFPNPSH